MTEFVATTPGLFPLPDWAKGELSDLKGHQKEDLVSGNEGPEITATTDRARTAVVEDQQNAGLDRIVEGQLRWDDMLAHPLAVHENVETKGIVRYYDNNNFYRDPVVTGDLTFSGDLASDLEQTTTQTENLQAVLPGPYSLADLASNKYYEDDAAFLDAVGEFLAGEVNAFPETETLYLLEPSLVTNPPEDGVDAHASEVIDAVAKATDAEVVVQSYWGALTEKVHAHLLDADIDAVGYDFISDHEQNLYNINEYGTKESISLGITDGQNTLVETAEKVNERVDWVLDNAPAATFDTVYMTPNTELFYLPVNKYQEKLAALGEAVALRKEVTTA